MKPILKLNRKNEPAVFPDVPSLFDDSFMRDLFNFPFKSHLQKEFLPALNVIESHDSFMLELAIPGADKKDLKIELKEGTLIISAKREELKESDNQLGNYRQREFSYQSFERSFELPEEHIVTEAISANYKNGILYVKLPKKEQAFKQQGKLISID